MVANLSFKKVGSGKPIILLHGLFGGKENLGQTARALADQFEVYSLDLRNHGASEHVDTMNYSEMAEDVVYFMKNQQIPSAILIGHSMGGKVAMEIAISYPDKVDKLVVVDIAPIEYRHQHKAIIAGFLDLQHHLFDSRSDANKLLSEYVPEESVRQFLLTNLVRSDIKPEKFKWRLNISILAKYYSNIIADISPGTFEKPTLFLKGDLSKYINDRGILSIRDRFPNHKIVTVPNAGHWLHAENTDYFIDCVRSFITIR